MLRPIAFVLPVLICSASAIAQDTLRVDMHQADSLLISRSLDLLAQHYEIDKAEADRVQAKLFNNPDFGSEWSINPSSGSFFDVGPNGEKAFSIDELFRIAGQRSLAIREAEQRRNMSEAEYAELASTLRLRLHSDLHEQFYTGHALATISSQLDLLKGLVDAYGQQYQNGNVSLKEVTRLRASYFDLNDQRMGLERQLNGLQEDLHILLNDQRTIISQPVAAEVLLIRTLPMDSIALIAQAMKNRPQVLAANDELAADSLDLKLQRRTTVPDLSLGVAYDQNGGYIPHYYALTAGFSLPIFDRNQAQIKRAAATLEEAKARSGSAALGVREEVLRSLADLRSLQNQYTATSEGFGTQLDQLSESLVGNYTKSNISLLEFTDLFESYNASIIGVDKLKADLQNAYDELEFATGQRLFDR